MPHGLTRAELLHDQRLLERRARLGEATEWIRRGKRDVMVAGGAEATVTPGRHRRLRGDDRALASATTTRKAASRPFDKRARRLRLRRGRAASSCSSRSRARRSAARRSTPRSPATAPRATPTTSRSPRPHGEGAQRSMRMALEGRAGLARRRSTTSTRTAPRRRSATSRSRRPSPTVFGAHAHRQEALGQLDQVDDGAPPRRRRRGRERDLRARDRTRARSRRRSTSIDQDPECPLDYVAEHGARAARPARAEQLVRLRRHELLARPLALRRMTA